MLSLLNFIVSLALISMLFAAIYKVLPDRAIAWRDVITGAVVTALLFTAGKSLIGWYLGSSAVTSSYGAAGGLIILLLWVYYSTQIFLLGAEFTKAYASSRGGYDPGAARQNNSRATDEDRGTKRARTSSSARMSNPPAPTAEPAMFTTNDNESSLRELERDAERNRANLMETVDALQKRMSPTAIKHDVQDYVRSRKDRFLESLEQTARDNPVQTVAIAAGAAYPLWGLVSRIPVPLLLIGAGLALTRRSTEGNGPGVAHEAQERLGRATDTARQKIGEVAEAVRGRVEDGMESARRTADRMAEYPSRASKSLAVGIRERASESAETLRGMSSDAIATAGDMLNPVRFKRAGTLASDWLDDTVSRNPLIVGAVGLAIGAIIAAALPATQQEDKLLGRAADDVKRRAQDAALEGAETVKSVATELYREAASQAKEQGLTVDDAKEFAGQISEKVRTAVANVSGVKQQATDPDENSPHNTSGAAG